jgi:hypothetical protein
VLIKCNLTFRFGACAQYTLDMEGKTRPQRIGIIVLAKPNINEAALQSFVLAMNKEQDLFQLEFYKLEMHHPLIARLRANRKPVDKNWVEEQLPDFTENLRQYLIKDCIDYDLHEGIPDQYILICQCRFADEYYTTRISTTSIIAFGNWRRFMAPPSLLEFIQVLIVREAVSILCPSLSGSIHLGTKSCLMDFTPYLSDARQKVLAGYVCHFCASRILRNSSPRLLAAVVQLVDRRWLGLPSDPYSPAGVASSLGADLFIVKGLRANTRERIITVFQEEGVKQIVVVVGTIVVAVLLVLFGIKNGG